jgi:hypothetical protein
MWAASEGGTAAAESLIEFGADVKGNPAGYASLRRRGEHKDTVRRCSRMEPTPTMLLRMRQRLGTSALNMAVVNAYFEVAAVLLDHGRIPTRRTPADQRCTRWRLRKPGSDGGNGQDTDPRSAADRKRLRWNSRKRCWIRANPAYGSPGREEV